ncbi:MAG: F0F1 ATP synthase subunit B [Balneolaceae bacterium]
MLYYLNSGGALLNFDTGFGIWVLFSTILFVWVFQKFLVPPIMKALDDREQRIKESLESADRALAKAERISQDNEKAMKQAEIQAQKIRKEALEDAEVLRSEKIEKAKQEAAKILDDAKRTIEQEKKRALMELRNEVADLAVKSASIIIEQELDETKNRALVTKYINEFPKN